MVCLSAAVLVRVRPLRGAVPQHRAAFVGANRRGEENDRGEPQGHHPRHVFVRWVRGDAFAFVPRSRFLLLSFLA